MSKIGKCVELRTVTLAVQSLGLKHMTQSGASKIAIRKAKHTGPVVHGLEVGSGLGPEPKYLSVQFVDTSGPR